MIFKKPVTVLSLQLTFLAFLTHGFMGRVMHILSPIPLKHWAQASIEIVEGDFRSQERNVQSH